jgi:hypothetical protein
MGRTVFNTICCYLDCEQLSTFNLSYKMICEQINYEISKKRLLCYCIHYIAFSSWIPFLHWVASHITSDYITFLSVCSMFVLNMHAISLLVNARRKLYLPLLPLALQVYLFNMHGCVDNIFSEISVTHVRPWGYVKQKSGLCICSSFLY